MSDGDLLSSGAAYELAGKDFGRQSYYCLYDAMRRFVSS